MKFKKGLTNPGKLIKKINTKVRTKLRTIFSSKPRKIPDEFYNEFTMDGRIPVVHSFRDEEYSPNKPIIFSFGYIEKLKQMIRNGEVGKYHNTDPHLYSALKKYYKEIQGKEGVDMGSIDGWYASVALAFNARKVRIVEYNPLVSKHPNLEVFQCDQFWEDPIKSDFAFSISSFEHDGLGRFGDPIDPNADLDIMKKMKSIVKKRGLLFLAVPIGKDVIKWNLNRVYGKIRFPKLIEGWELIDSFGFKEEDFNREIGKNIQPVFVLRNI
jgi:hypothetical protein